MEPKSSKLKNKKGRTGASITVYQREQRLAYKNACAMLGVKMGAVAGRFIAWFAAATPREKRDFYYGEGTFLPERK
jgi:ribosomal protein L34E